jgi:hypothetical protein
MARHTILPIVLVVLPATSLLTAQAASDHAMADECRTKPGLTAPRNAHWHYRPNPINHQRCWFLVAEQMRSHARQALSYVHRSPRVLLKRAQYDSGLPQTASAQFATGLTNPSLLETSALVDFAARWPDLPSSRNLEAREVMTVSYMEKDPATDTHAQTQAGHARPRQGEQAFGSVFLPSVLPMAFLFLAGAIFKFARKTDVRDGWRSHASRLASKPHGADLEETTGRTSSAAACYDVLVQGSPKPTASAYYPKERPEEIMRDLLRAGPAHHLRYTRALS